MAPPSIPISHVPYRSVRLPSSINSHSSFRSPDISFTVAIMSFIITMMSLIIPVLSFMIDDMSFIMPVMSFMIGDMSFIIPVMSFMIGDMSFIIEIINLSQALRLITTVMMPEPVKDSV